MDREEPDHFRDHAAKKLIVADRRDPRALGRALLVVDEHQVDVATVVQLLAAELPERQYGAAGRMAGGMSAADLRTL